MAALSSVLVIAAAGGADTARATLLCSTAKCAEKAYPANTPLSASLEKGTEFELHTNLGTVKCESSTIAGKTTAEGGEPLPLEVSELSFGKCKLGTTECTVTTTTLPSSPSLEATGEGDGILSLGGSVEFKCGNLIKCTYAMPSLPVEGGNPATLGVEASELASGKGFFCPKTAKLDVTYTLFEPAPAFAVEREGQTVLCANPSCEPAGAYPANTPLSASLEKGTEFELHTNLGTVKCESSSLAGKTTAEEGEPLPLEVSELSFSGNCNLGGTPCTITTTVLPASPSLEATGEGDGILSLETAEVNFKCGSLINCTYAMNSMIKPLHFDGGNPATLDTEESELITKKGFFCPKTSKLDASYTLTEPAPAFAVEREGQTVLCANPSCESPIYPANTALKASLQEGTSAQLLTNLGTVKCESSTIAGKTTAEEGEPLPLEVSELSFGGCVLSGKTECTATTAALPTSPSLEAEGEGEGTLSLEGGEVQLKCGGAIDCAFAAPALRFEGGNPAALVAEEVVPEYVKGSLCPGASAFDITYTLTEPAPAYLVVG